VYLRHCYRNAHSNCCCPAASHLHFLPSWTLSSILVDGGLREEELLVVLLYTSELAKRSWQTHLIVIVVCRSRLGVVGLLTLLVLRQKKYWLGSLVGA